MHPVVRVSEPWTLSKRTVVVIALTSIVASSCDDVSCPIGTTSVSGRCVSSMTSGVDADGSVGSIDGDGSPSPSNPSSGSSSSRSGSGGASGRSGSGGASGSAGSDASSAASNPCRGRTGGTLCDKSVLLHCDASGKPAERETCSDEMSCQLGLSTGKCSKCNPGSFKCTGAQLESCNSTGQYVMGETCSSAALCNATAGACTTDICAPNTMSCAADGTLQTCNADGSAIIGSKPCGANKCDAQNKRCIACVASSKACDGDSVVTCAADGLSMELTACNAGGAECMAATCVGDACAMSPMPAKTKCAAGICDGSGECVGCLTDPDCTGANEACVDQRCITKVCTANETICTSDGTLQTCNSDGTSVEGTPRACGPGLCDAENKTCFGCVPNKNTCNGATAVRCSAAGVPTNEVCTAANDCSTAMCDPAGGVCKYGKQPPGSACTGSGGAHLCDGQGNCSWECNGNDCAAGSVCNTTTHQCENLCPNGTVDDGEQCDPMAGAWINSGACTGCRRTESVYRKCQTVGEPCWPGTTDYYCSPVGSCSRACTLGNDAPCAIMGKTARCLDMGPGHGPVCGIVCSGAGAPTSTCGSGLTCQYVGPVGSTTAPRLCGWLSVDLDSMTPWCPAGTSCCFDAATCL